MHNYTCILGLRVCTFEPMGNMCALLLVAMAHAFGMVAHVQQSVRRMAKCTLKEFREVSEVLKASRNVRICLFPFFALLAAAHSYSMILLRYSRGSSYILALCLHFCFRISSFLLTLITVFCHFDFATMRLLAPLQH